MIEAKLIKASKNVYTGTKIATFELDYPRFIHSEIMTHRMFSRNAQSSRAVPVTKTLEVNKEWVRPLVWGSNKAGMSSSEELNPLALAQAKGMWDVAAEHSFICSKQLSQIGLHKQWANRITEPFSRIKVVVTATEWDNFFWLRIDPDAAQPEIVELAKKIKDLYDSAYFQPLKSGQWHVPYIDTSFDSDGEIRYYDSNGEQLDGLSAIQISASCCAQVSYRKLDDSKEKALEIYQRLFSGPKPHLSPVEHQACSFYVEDSTRWSEIAGVTHVDQKGCYWSGNFRDFLQYRQLIS